MARTPELTLAQIERLALLSEEAGEVIQVIGKILRHGYESYHPASPEVLNKDLLAKELGDLSVAVALVIESGDVVEADVYRQVDIKTEAVVQYIHEQENLDLLGAE